MHPWWTVVHHTYRQKQNKTTAMRHWVLSWPCKWPRKWRGPITTAFRCQSPSPLRLTAPPPSYPEGSVNPQSSVWYEAHSSADDGVESTFIMVGVLVNNMGLRQIFLCLSEISGARTTWWNFPQFYEAIRYVQNVHTHNHSQTTTCTLSSPCVL